MEAKTIAQSYFMAVAEGRYEDIPKFKSAASTYWISGEGSWPLGGWRTPEDMKNVFGLIQERFPAGLKITIRSIICEGDHATVHLNNRAERIDGKLYDNEIVILMTIKEGLIVEEREFLDTVHVNELFFGELLKQ